MTLTTINLAALGDTINLTTEVTGTLPIANGGTNSTATTFVNAATNVTGTLPSGNLPTVPVTKGGTGITSGTTDQFLKFTGSTTVGSAAVEGGLQEADNWRLTTGFNGAASPITSNWERSDNLVGHLGTGMSESSGIFSFPSTGIWYVEFTRILYCPNLSANNSILIKGSSDNFSSAVNLVQGYGSSAPNSQDPSNNDHGQVSGSALFDCINVSTYKVSFHATNYSSVADLYTTGSTNQNSTYAVFMKMGAT